ncbi:neuromedin-U receptor 1 [Sphaerodactylus townsendi]|uniref:neuromedin-U receptor 1 n=1 Tax=Sphaerodactylus townsendi TaxID=933632 RepID=UPI002026C732|nr:neuromedin-U receptor 1 [Sphaerodactylus townsendi]
MWMTVTFLSSITVMSGVLGANTLSVWMTVVVVLIYSSSFTIVSGSSPTPAFSPHIKVGVKTGQECYSRYILKAGIKGNPRRPVFGRLQFATMSQIKGEGETGSEPANMYSSANCSNLELKSPGLELTEMLASQNPCDNSSQEARGSFFDPEVLNMTAEQLRIRYLGPRRSGFFIPICTTYLLIFVVGAVGNTLTCLVIIQHRIMRTPTNYYLFSLAVSDLLVLLLGMPLEIYEMWSNYPFLLGAGGCCFKTLLFEAVCFASILNVTALSVERYIAVVHPLRAKYVVTKKHAKRVIVAVWLLSVVCSIPNTSLHGIQTLYVPGWGVVPDSATCTLVKSRLLYNLIIQVTTIIFFFIPMGIISILYLLIGLQLRKEKMLEALEAKSGTICDYHNIRLQQKKVRRRQVTKMLCKLRE